MKGIEKDQTCLNILLLSTMYLDREEKYVFKADKYCVTLLRDVACVEKFQAYSAWLSSTPLFVNIIHFTQYSSSNLIFM